MEKHPQQGSDVPEPPDRDVPAPPDRDVAAPPTHDDVDESVEESFPASDPPSTQPLHSGSPDDVHEAPGRAR
jgi:hypothetical protein